MIAPRSKLLWATLFIGVPLVALVSFAPLPTIIGLLLCLSIATWDIYRAFRFAGAIQIQTTERNTWFQFRPANFSFTVVNHAGVPQDVRIHFDLPAKQSEPQLYQLETKPDPMELFLPCTPRERGQFRVTEAQLEVTSPLGLWHVRETRSVASEIRVYPDLRADRVSLLLARQPTGSRRQRQAGKGREFEKLRDYLPGDRYDEIHWRASARHGRPVVKVTQIERTQQVYVVLDSSRLSARNGVLDRFVHAALGIAMAAEQQNDRFGLVLFSDQVSAFVPAASGKAHFAACRDAVYTAEPRRVSPDFEELFSFLQLRIRTRSLLLFLTALDDPLLAELFLKNVRLSSRRHLVMACVPKLEGARPLFTGREPEDLPGVYERLAGHMQWGQLRELGKTLEHSGVKLLPVNAEQATVEVARQYFDVKRRQLL